MMLLCMLLSSDYTGAVKTVAGFIACVIKF